jgi:hypothetical protein
MSEQPVAFDRITGRRFVRAVKYFLTSEVRWQARGLFALLFAFAFTINGLNVLHRIVPSRRNSAEPGSFGALTATAAVADCF